MLHPEDQIKFGLESQKRFRLSTHCEVLLQTYLPFITNSAPCYFQELTDQLNSDLSGVAIYFKNLLGSGVNAEEHLQNLRTLLQCL